MRGSPGQIVAAILLPPLGVYLARGGSREFASGSQEFAIACGLTLLGYMPGAAYALWVVLKGDGAVPV